MPCEHSLCSSHAGQCELARRGEAKPVRCATLDGRRARLELDASRPMFGWLVGVRECIQRMYVAEMPVSEQELDLD